MYLFIYLLILSIYLFIFIHTCMDVPQYVYSDVYMCVYYMDLYMFQRSTPSCGDGSYLIDVWNGHWPESMDTRLARIPVVDVGVAMVQYPMIHSAMVHNSHARHSADNAPAMDPYIIVACGDGVG